MVESSRKKHSSKFKFDFLDFNLDENDGDYPTYVTFRNFNPPLFTNEFFKISILRYIYSHIYSLIYWKQEPSEYTIHSNENQMFFRLSVFLFSFYCISSSYCIFIFYFS